MSIVFGDNSSFSRQPLALLSGIFVVLIWAIWYVVSRWGVLGNMTPADITLVRYVTGTVVTLPFFWLWRGRKIPWLILLILVPSYGVPYVLPLFIGLREAPAANAGVLLNGLLPIFNAVMAWFVFRQGIGMGKVVAIVILTAANGCMLVVGIQEDSLSLTWLWIIVATLCISIYLTFYRKHPIDFLLILPAMSLGNLILFMPFWAVMPSTLTQASWQEILLQAVFQGIINQVLVIFLISYMIPRLGSVSTSVLYGFVPAITAFCGWLVLDESLRLLELLGIAGCTVGIIFFSRSK